MNTILRDSTPTARKKHSCDGYYIIVNSDCADGHSDHKDAFDQYKACGSVIDKGQKYINQVVDYGGDVGNYKSCQGCHDICEKYNLFENE